MTARWCARLNAEPCGAREVEHAARNPGCLRRQALLLAGVRPATAAREVFQVDPAEGQSPFAITYGLTFERHLTEHGAERLLDAYRRDQVFRADEDQVLDLEAAFPLPDCPSPAEMRDPPRRARYQAARRETLWHRQHRTAELLQSQEGGLPSLVLKPRLCLRIGDLDLTVEPDALRVIDTGYCPVEIKSYIDRGGRTNPADLRSARRQLAVYVVAQQQTLAMLGSIPPAPPLAGDLVLRRDGQSFAARVQPMTLLPEIDAIEQLIAGMPQALADVERILGGRSLDDPVVLAEIPARYVPDCKEHCALLVPCRREARACGNPAVLGDEVRHALAGVPDLARAHALMLGTAPTTVEEETLARDLVDVYAILRDNRHG